MTTFLTDVVESIENLERLRFFVSYPEISAVTIEIVDGYDDQNYYDDYRFASIEFCSDEGKQRFLDRFKLTAGDLDKDEIRDLLYHSDIPYDLEMCFKDNHDYAYEKDDYAYEEDNRVKRFVRPKNIQLLLEDHISSLHEAAQQAEQFYREACSSDLPAL